MDVRDVLLHRAPFLMVDRLLEIEEGKWAVARKCVAENEPYFAGHFPDFPVMPGVLLVEAIAQTAALAAEGALGDGVGVLAGIDEARFRRPVRPGDVVIVRSEILNLRRSLGRARGEARVDGELAASATVLFAVRSMDELRRG